MQQSLDERSDENDVSAAADGSNMEKDEYTWEIGFHIAFVQVVFTMILLYALVSPLITLFGALFFTIKYFVDKYNQVYVYPKLYDSKGSLAYHIGNLGFGSLMFQQFIVLLLLKTSLNKRQLVYAIKMFIII